jgi:hypothetical protein
MLAVSIFLLLALSIKIFSVIGEQEDRIDELCDRLTKLEKDAVKITFDTEKDAKQ